MAYALGKAQEAMAVLASHCLTVTVETGIYKLSLIYERFGVDLGDYSQYRGGHFEGALIVPPHMRKFKSIKSISNTVFAMLTGWGAGEGTRNLQGIDCTFPISDHCDYTMLMKYVEAAEPRKIFTLHGCDGFAGHLRSRGIDAQPMKPGMEYRLAKSSHPVNIDLFE